MLTIKKHLVFVVSILLGAMLLWLGLNGLHYVGIASAQGASMSFADPGSDIVAFLTNGQYLPAVGAGLVMLVGLMRTGLAKKFPWFATQIGGYVLSYATTMLIYVGTSLEQGQGITLKLLLTGLAAALGAAGVLDHWRDMKGAVKKIPPAAAAATMLLIGLGAATVLGGSTSCGANPPRPIADLVDCSKQDSAQIAAAEADCASKIPDWSAAEACVVGKLPKIGWQIGGCVIADLAQQYLSSKKATLDHAQSVDANKALEDFRAQYGHGSSFRVGGHDL